MSRTVPRTISRAIRETIEQLRVQGFNELYIRSHRWVWDKFVAYASGRGKHYFSDSLSHEYVLSLSRHKPSVARTTLQGARRAMRILREHVAYGNHRRKPPEERSVSLPPFMRRAFILFIDHAQTQLCWSRSTVRNRASTVQRFLGWMRDEGVKGWDEATPAQITSYLETLSGLAVNTRVAVVTAIRQFCRVMFAMGVLAKPLHDNFPQFRQFRGNRLLQLWTAEEIRKTLAVVDRGKPRGKRDYAILLLAARLGMRVSDILKLRLDDIHWESSFIEVTQQKTGIPLRLPLPDDVGDAMADYLRRARPTTPRREVFLTCFAPYGPFGPDNNLHQLPQLYRARAGLPRRDFCGLHSLRHTLATQLLEAGANCESIGGLLGHKSLDTTLLYLRFDATHLRQAGLDPDEEVRHA